MILLDIIKLRRKHNSRVATAGWQPPAIDVLAAEYCVLPLGRFCKDTAYWLWICAWLAILPPLVAIRWVPFMAGCRSYFELRDTVEFPVLHRWYRYRWAMARRARR